MKAIVFSPGHAVWAWGYTAGLTAEALQKRGHEILYLYCDRELEKFCMAQAGMGVPFGSSDESRAEICAKCSDNRRLITEKMKLPSASINSFISEADRLRAKRIVDGVTPENCRDLEIEGVHIGRLALYEFIIQNMKRSITFQGREWEQYLTILENACRATLGFISACETFKPDACLIEHTSYSYNRACQLIAEKKGIPAYYINENSYNIARMSELMIVAKGDPLISTQRVVRDWIKFKDTPINAEEARLVTDHFIALTQAKGRAFSTARESKEFDVRARFGIHANQKILLAMTSSYDEIFAAEAVGNFGWDTRSEVFELQIDWIKALIDFTRKRPDLFLIVRVHPREFLAREGDGKSEHARSLMEELRDLPNNVAVNWPSDRISLYDLIEEVDVGLNAWSSAGSELSFFGIPVVVYCGHLLLYPESLNYSAKTREEYFRLIDVALKDGWSFDRVRELYRWYTTLQVRMSAEISDSFPSNLLRKRSFFERAYFKFRRIFNRQYDFIYRIDRRAEELARGEAIEKLLLLRGDTFLDLLDPKDPSRNAKEEDRIIRGELSRLYFSMYHGRRDRSSSNTLRGYLAREIDPRP